MDFSADWKQLKCEFVTWKLNQKRISRTKHGETKGWGRKNLKERIKDVEGYVKPNLCLNEFSEESKVD